MGAFCQFNQHSDNSQALATFGQPPTSVLVHGNRPPACRLGRSRLHDTNWRRAWRLRLELAYADAVEPRRWRG